jgi:hypothetical protein
VISASPDEAYYQLFLARNGRASVSFTAHEADREADVRLRFRLGRSSGFVDITVVSENELEGCVANDRFDVRRGPR